MQLEKERICDVEYALDRLAGDGVNGGSSQLWVMGRGDGVANALAHNAEGNFLWMSLKMTFKKQRFLAKNNVITIDRPLDHFLK